MTADWTMQIDGWIILAGVLSACSCALLGNYLILRKMSLMGDAISHAVLPGIAAAFMISGSRAPSLMFVGAVVVGVITALLSEIIRRHGKVEHGAAMGVVFSVLFAAGLIMIRQAADQVDIDPECVLLGNIELIPFDALTDTVPTTIIHLGVVALLNSLFVCLLYKELKISTFDPALATTLGINATMLHYALMVMVAVTTVACFEAVGSILVIAMLIVPPSAAYLLTDRLGMMIPLSLLIALAAAVLGHLFSTHGPGWLELESVPSFRTAPLMAVVSGGLFCVALFLSPRYGIISRMARRASLSTRIVAEDILGLLYRWQELRADRLSPMARQSVMEAVGGGWMCRAALWWLRSKGLVECVGGAQSTKSFRLTDSGMGRAASLVRSHRLWETYLARHFDLPLDHLHMPAERMEHYITPAMSDYLEDDVGEASHDPHGKALPRPPSEPGR
ncbi:MAG: metal ABC transporter permease [Planctomycetota bacterium]|jgi:manganese/zinc/iron transport system permease protein